MNLTALVQKAKDVNWARPSLLALLAANAVPLLGVVVLGWEVFPLMLLFWFENVIIGVLNALKMLLASASNAAGWALKLFLLPFFCFHYGMFTFVHGMFVLAMFGKGFAGGPGFSPLNLLGEAIKQDYLGWAILGLAVSHGVSFVTNYIRGGEYRRATAEALMMQPYGRVVVLHVTILIGGALTLILGSPAIGLAMLVVLKTGLDIRAHLKERKKFAPAPVVASSV